MTVYLVFHCRLCALLHKELVMTNVFLAVHIFLGSIAVLGMAMAWLSRKGDIWHRRGGKAYVLGMAGSLAAAFAVSILTRNIFLFLVGLFSAYLVYTGYRLAAARNSVRSSLDKSTAVTALVSGLGMIAYGVYLVFSSESSMAIVIAVFGVLSASFGYSDVRLGDKWPAGKERIILHLSRMGGANIATVTAVFVVNVKTDPAFIAWLIPSVVGALLIAYWTRRTRDPGWKPLSRVGS